MKNNVLLVLVILVACASPIATPNSAKNTTPIIVTLLLEDSQATSTATIRVNWTPPTQLTNGSSISPSDIKSYRIQVKNMGDNQTRYALVDGQQVSTEIDKLSKGSYALRMLTIDNDDVQGVYSEPVNFSID